MKVAQKNVFSKILSASKEELEILEKILTIQVERWSMRSYGRKRTRYKEIIKEKFFSRKKLLLWSGLLELVESRFKDLDFEFVVVDVRSTDLSWPEKLSLPPGIDRRKYQTVTVSRAKRRSRGIIHIGTGGGKLEIGAAILWNLSPKRCIYMVPTTSLAAQTRTRLSQRLQTDIGLFGAGEHSFQEVTVCLAGSLWSRRKNPEVIKKLEECDLLLLDECHRVGSSSKQHTWSRVAQLCKNAYYRYGMSATPFREDPIGSHRLLAATGNVFAKFPS